MRKNQVNKILVNQTKRRNSILSFLCVIIILLVIAVSFLVVYYKKNNEQFTIYSENSNIDYKVYLRNNDFFEDDYLSKDKQYIASLIDYITAEFNYNLELSEENIKYKYLYYIDANVEVKDKTTHNILYSYNDKLVNSKENIATDKNTKISEFINIDYNRYNDLISKFVNVYELTNAVSTLNIDMHVNVQSLCDDGNKVDEKNSVISLSVPLTTQTIAVDLSNNLINSKNDLLKCYDNSKYSVFVLFSVICFILDFILILFMLRYVSNTRSAESIYERELKKILNNYGTYIQVLGNGFCFKDYQVLKLDSFTDMLEIRDTIRQPILMRENYQKDSAYFVIPGDTKILYVYRLNVEAIKKEIKK